MSKIRIKSEPVTVTEFFYGTYTSDKSLWEDEYQEDVYPFILKVVNDDVFQNYMITIDWEDGVPKNQEAVENEIELHFLNKKL